MFSPTLLSCSTALCVLYNRTAQSRIIYLLNTTSCDGVRLVVKFYLFRLGLCIRTRSIWYLLSNANIVSSAFSFELFLNILFLVNLTPFTINLQYPFPRAIGGHLFQGKAHINFTPPQGFAKLQYNYRWPKLADERPCT